MLKQQFEVNGHFFKKYDSVIDVCDISSALDVASILFFTDHTLLCCSTPSSMMLRCVLMPEPLETMPVSSGGPARLMLRSVSFTAVCKYISYHYPAADNNLVVRMRNVVNMTGFIGLLFSEG